MQLFQHRSHCFNSDNLIIQDLRKTSNYAGYDAFYNIIFGGSMYILRKFILSSAGCGWTSDSLLTGM